MIVTAIVVICAMISIVEIIALIKNIDGMLLFFTLSSMFGVVGYLVRFVYEKSKE